MSSSIWTRCAGDSELRPLRLSPWRVVEAQHHFSTRKLVDTAEEQMLLEELIEHSKPPARASDKLHYLLATPFRYPPLRQGSRFGTRFDIGIWYGSELQRTAFAEVGYYRLLFLEGTSADLGTITTQLTAFTVRVRSDRGIDLTVSPFVAHRKVIASPSSYSQTQPLGAAMRASNVDVVRYPSARDQSGINVAVLSAAAFGTAKPRQPETWHCTANTDRVEFGKHDYFARESFVFERGVFLVDGRLPVC